MRRFVSPGLLGPVLIGLGTFLIVVGVLVRFYAYPSLAKVPANYDSYTYLEAEGAEIFNSDPEVLAPETVDLEVTSHTVSGDYPDAPEGVVVWANSVTVTPVGWDHPFQQSTELSPFDETTGAASSYDVGFEEVETDGTLERVEVTRDGQVYKFPFGTEKKDYPVWDGSIGAAAPATFEGTEEVQGLEVYKFVQRIEPTVIETRDVPGSVFGVDEASVEADMVYEMTRTFYVEPVTGSPVDRVEERNQVLSYDGTEVPAFVGTVEYTEESVDDAVDNVAGKAPLLEATRALAPILLGVVGALALLGGFLLGRRATGARRDDREHELVDA